MNRVRIFGLAAMAVYIGAIFLANYLIHTFGFIKVWPFALTAPAGVYAAGITFPARDVVQRYLGLPWGVAAIIIGAALSWAISPTLAVASGVTFLASETLDLVLYTPLQRRWFTPAVLISSVFSAVVDSLLFLYLAHIPYSVALAGQIVGKLEVILIVGWPIALLLRRYGPVPATAAARERV